MTYDDGLVRADADGLLVRHYYFPLGSPKRIRWVDLRGHEVRPLGFWSRHRAWGTHRPDWWFPSDAHRARKDRMIILRVGRVSPVVTPDDVDALAAEIDARRP